MIAKKLLETVPKSIRVIRRLSSESLNGELALQQLRILILVRDGFGQTQMAENLGVSLAAISKVIDNLVKKEFLTRQSGSDRRTVVLKLTPKGKKTLNAVLGQVESKLENSIKTLTPEEKDTLMKGLFIMDKLMINLNELNEVRP